MKELSELLLYQNSVVVFVVDAVVFRKEQLHCWEVPNLSAMMSSEEIKLFL